MSQDWIKLETEFVNSTMTQRELAAKYGISNSTMMSRASRGDWQAKREQIQVNASKIASARMGEERIDQLTKFNDADIKIASALKSRAAQMMAGVDNPIALRALAGVFESAQKMGRVALGADVKDDKSNAPMVVEIKGGLPK